MIKYSKNTNRDLKSGIITINIWSGTDKQKWNNLKWTMNRNLKEIFKIVETRVRIHNNYNNKSYAVKIIF